ncbi:hypothetical protein CKAH01_18826 [Colletotrichum kahawae]|uniref:Uncharacterized protein n=1 Tax=Colletotrichum kahawae TaxID=34407 RepID=A0AAD9Y3V1_COLKA|nr:hypothetical protein CKAH01_18826 [Colletotrichum kahawae]
MNGASTPRTTPATPSPHRAHCPLPSFTFSPSVISRCSDRVPCVSPLSYDSNAPSPAPSHTLLFHEFAGGHRPAGRALIRRPKEKYRTSSKPPSLNSIQPTPSAAGPAPLPTPSLPHKAVADDLFVIVIVPFMLPCLAACRVARHLS